MSQPHSPHQRARVTVMTWNVWCTAGAPALWELRELSFVKLLQTFSPDVLCVQESHEVIARTICDALPDHVRLFGLKDEGNIFVNSRRFEGFSAGDADAAAQAASAAASAAAASAAAASAAAAAAAAAASNSESSTARSSAEGGFGAAVLASATAALAAADCAGAAAANRADRAVAPGVDRGSEPLDLPNNPARELKWARLRVLQLTGSGGGGSSSSSSLMSGSSSAHQNCACGGSELFVSTVHLPWVGSAEDLATGVNQRARATDTVCRLLRRLLRANEPSVLCGDFNEDYAPLRILEREIGFRDCFSVLGLPARRTHPARPSHPREEALPDRALDWVTANAAARPLMAQVVETALMGERVHPSDHFPVLVLYEV